MLISRFLMSNDLLGCLEAAMASEVAGGNMHMDTRIIKVADFKSEVVWRTPWPRRPLWPWRPLEAMCTWIPG